MNPKRTAKAYTAGIAYAATELVVWFVTQQGVEIPLEVKAAIGVVVSWLAVYFIPNKQPEQESPAEQQAASPNWAKFEEEEKRNK